VSKINWNLIRTLPANAAIVTGGPEYVKVNVLTTVCGLKPVVIVPGAPAGIDHVTASVVEAFATVAVKAWLCPG